MDSGKKSALVMVKWKPVNCCGSCRFSSFDGNPQSSEWGLCKNEENNYIHNKHNRLHELPAHRGAVCEKFQPGRAYSELDLFLKSKITS